MILKSFQKTKKEDTDNHYRDILALFLNIEAMGIDLYESVDSEKLDFEKIE